MSSSNRIITFEVTPSLASARKSVGDATRCLNGIIVALETLKHVEPVKPPDLQMSWHKSNSLGDFEEMRTFAVKSAIVTVMDGLDQYLRVTSRVPGLVPEALHDDLNGRRDPKIERRRTVAERLRVLASYLPNAVDGRILLIVDLLGAWRNEFVHGDKRHRLGNRQLKEIKASDAWFKSERGGADVVGLVHRYQDEQRKHPRGDAGSSVVRGRTRV
ncbi:hypothetical protein O8B93_12085 [Agrobacterium rhizogenes]|uniref:hypothetical protein n=1 Tax=Rhizobium rhizogenes TaxID=359 RepID=UPI0022B62A7A|nr:hypothetical protein [Rhizobium rhizogenes]MCZ7448324.1 hypothetical protein [Rhizobium rhizogenes]